MRGIRQDRVPSNEPYQKLPFEFLILLDPHPDQHTIFILVKDKYI